MRTTRSTCTQAGQWWTVKRRLQLLTAALLGNLIMLPCVLASPLAYFFGRRLVRKAHAEHRDMVAGGAAPGGDMHAGGHFPTTNGDAASDTTRSQVRHDGSHRVRT